MTNLILIFTGFILIGIGVTLYVSEHTIIKHYTNKEYNLVNEKGDIVAQHIDRSIFDRYELTVKEK